MIKSATPFIVPTGYGEAPGQQPRVHDINGPVPTAVGKCHHGVVSPVMAPLTMHNNENAAGTAIRAGEHDHQQRSGRPSNADHPTLAAIGQTGGGDRYRSVEEPTHTQVSKAEECVVCPVMIQYHTEQSEKVRGQAVTDPIMTIDASNRYGLAAATLTKYYGSDQHGQEIRDPLHTTTAKDREGVTMASLSKFYGGVVGAEMPQPLPTVTAVDHNALQTAHMVKLKGTNLGGPVTEPVQTITAGGGHHGVVTTRIAKAEPGAPLQNWPKIREALNEFCGYQLAEDDVILFLIGGAWYFMADIGLRMLTPRELYRANGFPDDYKIERDYMGNVYGKSKQVARCGNAVPPPFATALVRANFPEWCGQTITTMAARPVQLPDPGRGSGVRGLHDGAGQAGSQVPGKPCSVLAVLFRPGRSVPGVLADDQHLGGAGRPGRIPVQSGGGGQRHGGPTSTRMGNNGQLYDQPKQQHSQDPGQRVRAVPPVRKEDYHRGR